MNNEQLKSIGIRGSLLVLMIFGQCILHQSIAQAEEKSFKERIQELKELGVEPTIVSHKPEESVEVKRETDSSFKMINVLIKSPPFDNYRRCTQIVDFQYSEGILACGNLSVESDKVCIYLDYAMDKDTLVIGDVTIPKELKGYCFILLKDSSGQTYVQNVSPWAPVASSIASPATLSIRGKCGDREFILSYKIYRTPGAKEDCKEGAVFY